MTKLSSLPLALIACITFANAEVYNGTCGAEGDGSNLHWSLNSDTKILTITGSGSMANYTWTNYSPWQSYAYQNMIDTIILPEGLTSVGDRAFFNISTIHSITIPEGVLTIGEHAIRGCQNLKNVVLPNSLTTIKSQALSQTGLKEISIPEGVSAIAHDAFYLCSDLTSIIWNAKNFLSPSSEVYAPFYSIASQITSFVFGEDIENIPDYLCVNMSNISNITLPATTKHIGEGVFYYCSGLSEIELPETLITIDDFAFIGCSSLSAITIPYNVTTFGDNVFGGCSNLITIHYNAKDCVTRRFFGSDTEQGQVKYFTIGEGVEVLPNNLCSDMMLLEEINIPSTVKSIGDNAFALCQKIDRMDVYAINPPEVQANTFYGVSRQAPVYVPDESYSSYKNHPLWGELNIIGRSQAPTALDQITNDQSPITNKIIRDSQILILRGDRTYTLTGQEIR